MLGRQLTRYVTTGQAPAPPGQRIPGTKDSGESAQTTGRATA